MTQNEAIQKTADVLWKHLKNGGTCAPVREWIGTEDLEAAYKAQEINTQRKIGEGAKVIGAKIGLTSKAVQQQLGVDQPDYGILTDRMKVEEGNSVPWDELHQPKAEAEIGFLLQSDLNATEPTRDDLIKAIGSVVPSIEIVGSRIENWNIRITDTIADNASASHFVIGKPVENWKDLDLIGCTMKLERNGELVSEGKGEACLGDPLNAALWLAKTMAKLGSPLKAGQIILAGALGPMVVAEPGDAFTAYIDGFDAVNVSFGRP